MSDGIIAGRSPLYFHYNGEDSYALLNKWFGKTLDSGTDTDGVPIGFVTDYATTDANEDFAETFSHYVYKPSLLYDKVMRQEANGSVTLSWKAALISKLYQAMDFNDNGVPAGWPGYPL